MKRLLGGIKQEHINQSFIFLVLLLCYTYIFPRWADPNQNSRLNMIVAVVDDGTFEIDKYVQNTVDYAKVGEHYYSDKAPGAAFLAMPFYAGLKVALNLPVLDGFVAKLSNSESFQSTLRAEGSGIYKEKVRFALAQVVLTFFVAAVPTAILGVLLYSLLAAFVAPMWPRLITVLIYGLLTPAFAYAGAFYGHQLSTALLFGAFYLAFTRREHLSVGALLAIGLLLGYSVVTEYPTAVMVGIIFLYAFYVLVRQRRWLQIGWTILAGAIVAALWMVYNNAIFGGPLNLGYSYSELWVNQHHTGFMSLTLPHPAAMWGITFGVFRGLFFLSPILLLAFPGFWLWWQSGQYRAEFLVAVASSLTIYLFNASSSMWWGGFAVGPRYLLPMLPFFALPLVLLFLKWGGRLWLKVLAGVLGGWSLVALWGLTLAEQAFPPDTIPFPLLDYALPNWLAGNIARNIGTILGFRGVSSLIPLLVLLVLLGVSWWLASRLPAKFAVESDVQSSAQPSTQTLTT